ncbi:MAG: acyl-CoA dehydrogenase family protein [Candidatus Dormibacteraeota bacterium]|nr:acyl-CoA dehydrogenase family protein [Candidatus Dormibacteraeota bacterium]MBO0744617.1 acyl-CoA dehydrogenase family protein [Candidatus Dormibacteraeota bacterium]
MTGMSTVAPRGQRVDPQDLLGLQSAYSDEERLIQSTVRRFVRERVLPGIEEWFEEGTFPRDRVPELAELGLLGMHLEGYGCAGTNATSYGLACLELEAGDSGFRSFVSVQGSLSMFPIWKYGSEEQKRHYLPRMARGEILGCFGLTEPDFGSDPAGMRTTARRRGDDWVLNGNKLWITNGSVADLAVVWAQTEEGIQGFLVPTATRGFTARDIHRKLSLRASVTSELILEDVVLPADAVLPGVRGLRGPLSCLSEARYGILWGSLGAARACYETALDYAKTRIQFERPIAGFQLTQEKLVEMVLELQKGELLAQRIGRLKDQGLVQPEHISMGKLNNVRTALRIAREARSVLGANGITLEYPVIRHMNNLESVYTYEGTNEVHLLTLGQAITGTSAFR